MDLLSVSSTDVFSAFVFLLNLIFLLIMVLCSRDLECHAIKKLGLLLLKVERLKISGFRFIRFLKVYETKLKFSIFLTLLT